VPDEAIVINPQLREYKTGPFGEGEYWVPQEPVIFDMTKPLPYGGAEYTAVIEPIDLDNNNIMVLRTMDFTLDETNEMSRVIEDLTAMSLYKDYSVTYADWLQPYYER